LDWSYLLTSFEGRIGRRVFWIALTGVVAVEIAAHLVAYRIEGERLSAIVDLAFSYPEFAICAKRGHDRNMAPWIVGLFFAVAVLMDFLVVVGLGGDRDDPSTLVLILTAPWAVFGLALLIDLGFRAGTPGPNRFGPAPADTV
jgi:uncharacterized membrane protein YhaH (DUF805 family)